MSHITSIILFYLFHSNFHTQAKTLFQEDLLKSSELITLQDALSQHTLETKASRETIMRLVSEVGREQKSVSETNNILEKLKKVPLPDYHNRSN